MAAFELEDGRNIELSIVEQDNPELYSLIYSKAIYKITKEIEECPWLETVYIIQSDIDNNSNLYHSTSIDKPKEHKLYTDNPSAGGTLIKTIKYTYPAENKMTQQVITEK